MTCLLVSRANRKFLFLEASHFRHKSGHIIHYCPHAVDGGGTIIAQQ